MTPPWLEAMRQYNDTDGVAALLALVEVLAEALAEETESNGWCHTCMTSTAEPEHAFFSTCPVAKALARYQRGPEARDAHG